MPRNENKKSIRAETAAMLLISRPDIGIRNAMQRSGYTKDESEKDNLQRSVRRHRNTMEQESNTAQIPIQQPPLPSLHVYPPQAGPTTAESSSSSSSTNKTRKRKKGYNLTSSQVMKKNAFENESKTRKQNAMSEATLMYAVEKRKEQGRSSSKIAQEMADKYNTSISSSTIRNKVIQGNIGAKAVLKRGPKGNFSKEEYKALCAAIS